MPLGGGGVSQDWKPGAWFLLGVCELWAVRRHSADSQEALLVSQGQEFRNSMQDLFSMRL